MANFDPQRIRGNWFSGYALDRHTLSSTHLGMNEAGHDVFDTKRSELGELLYRLKYAGDRNAATDIVAAAASFLQRFRTKFDIVVPVPPSGVRAVQPVVLLAEGIGRALGLPMVECVATTRPATPLKGVMDRAIRKELLAGLHSVDATRTTGKNILLFDDLFRSGATMDAVAERLVRDGEAARVYALTITRTRSHQ